MKRAFSGICSIIFLVGLGACGGSSGGGGNTIVPPPVTLAVIDSSNAEPVAGRSVDAALQSGSFGGLFGSTGLTAAAADDVSKSLAARSASRAVGKTISNIVVSEVPVGPETAMCAQGGTLTISGEIADPQTLTVGDTFTLAWASCNDGLGQVVDGTLDFTVTSFSGDTTTAEFLLGITINLQNFQVTAGNDISGANGDISLTIDTRSVPITVVTSSGDNFSVSNNGNTETLSSFSTTVTEDASMFPSSFSTDASGTITSTRFSGSVSYETGPPFLWSGDSYPSSGELLVTGAENATLRIIALDEVNVRIEADYDGVDPVDEVIDTTWDELLAL